MAPTFRATQGDLSNDKNLLTEPPDHAIGRSRGGLTTKIHALVDGNQRPLVMLLGPGQGGDSPMFENLMGALKVERDGSGRAPARTGPWQTRPTHPRRSGPTCGTGASSASSRKRTTRRPTGNAKDQPAAGPWLSLLYTSDAADDLTRVDLGGRRIIKKKKKKTRR